MLGQQVVCNFIVKVQFSNMNRNRKISTSGKKRQQPSSKHILNPIKSVKSLRGKSENRDSKNKQKQVKKQKKKNSKKKTKFTPLKYLPQKPSVSPQPKCMETKNTPASTASDFYLDGVKWLKNKKQEFHDGLPKKEAKLNSWESSRKARQRTLIEPECEKGEMGRRRGKRSLSCKIIKSSKIPFPLCRSSHERELKLERDVKQISSIKYKESQYFPSPEFQGIIGF